MDVDPIAADLKLSAAQYKCIHCREHPWMLAPATHLGPITPPPGRPTVESQAARVASLETMLDALGLTLDHTAAVCDAALATP